MGESGRERFKRREEKKGRGAERMRGAARGRLGHRKGLRHHYECSPTGRGGTSTRRRGESRVKSQDEDSPSPSSTSSSSSSSSSSPSPQALFDPSGLIVYGGRLPSRRRFLSGTGLALVTALGANFLGITSNILSLNTSFARRNRFDVLYPIGGYKRSLDSDNGFTFIYPERWLADQTLYNRYARKIEQHNPLDPPSLNRRKSQRDFSEPVAAYGPPGTSGALNVSVVVAPIEAEFTLKKLGTPEEAGELILKTFIAPPSQTDKVAELVSATSSDDGDYYFFEFTVESRAKGWKRRNLAVYGTSNKNLLYTLNCQCPDESFNKERSKLMTIANSFEILA